MKVPKTTVIKKLEEWIEEVDLDTSPFRKIEYITLDEDQVRDLLMIIEMIRKEV